MSERQKAANRLHIAATRYREAVEAEQIACKEWMDASHAMDAIEN